MPRARPPMVVLLYMYRCDEYNVVRCTYVKSSQVKENKATIN